VRAGDWKLIKRYDGKQFELFNLKDDLSETRDLSAKQPARVRELNTLIENWILEVNAKMPRPNPGYKPKA